MDEFERLLQEAIENEQLAAEEFDEAEKVRKEAATKAKADAEHFDPESGEDKSKFYRVNTQIGFKLKQKEM